MTTPESLWGSATDRAKADQRAYLQELLRDDPDRDALIKAREWCLDEWDQLRQDFFPEEDCRRPLQPPFIESTHQAGTTEEPAKYQLIGSQGQPSTIDIRRNLLLGTSDLTIAKWQDGEKRLVLKADHESRWEYIRGLLLHELLHQYLVEAAPADIRESYAEKSSRGNAKEGGELKTYKGHGNLFTAYANNINQQRRDPNDYVPMRIAKRQNAPEGLRDRIPCSWFGTLDRFFVWDPDAEGLTPEQVKDNDRQMAFALKWFGADSKGEGGAVELVVTEKPPLTFEAPFTDECFDVCFKELRAFDSENSRRLVDAFVTKCVSALHASGNLETVLDHIGYRRAQREIHKPAMTEQAIEYQDGSVHTIDEFLEDIGLGSKQPRQPDISTRGDEPEWLVHAMGMVANPDNHDKGKAQLRRDVVGDVIDIFFNGQKPSRRENFNNRIAELFGCSDERIRQLVKEHLNASQAAIAA